jgi:hypothetical protein
MERAKPSTVLNGLGRGAGTPGAGTPGRGIPDSAGVVSCVDGRGGMSGTCRLRGGENGIIGRERSGTRGEAGPLPPWLVQKEEAVRNEPSAWQE